MDLIFLESRIISFSILTIDISDLQQLIHLTIHGYFFWILDDGLLLSGRFEHRQDNSGCYLQIWLF